METYPIGHTSTGIEVDGIPDATRIVKLVDRGRARRVADLGLHLNDLRFSHECLTALREGAADQSPLKKALWTSALVHFFKCFGSSKSRFSLKARKVFSEEGQDLLGQFAYFSDLRNKHVVHDENSYTQSVPGAVLNNGEKPYKVEKVVCLMLEVRSMTEANRSNLELLVSRAHAWVLAQFDIAAAALSKELEKLPYLELSEMELFSIQAPQVGDVALGRHESSDDG